MMNGYSNIKNVILDFGGVLYEINQNNTIDGFKQYSQEPELLDNLNSAGLNEKAGQFEKGIINAAEFRHYIKTHYKIECSDLEFDTIWNDTLIGLFDYTADCVTRLKSKYNLALLSNTNSIHFGHFEPECRNVFAEFDKCFFSFLRNMKKPELVFYKRTLDIMNFDSSETLFADDIRANLFPAEDLGIKTFEISNANNLKKLCDMLGV